MTKRHLLGALALLAITAAPAFAQQAPSRVDVNVTGLGTISAPLQIVLLMTLLSFLPAILVSMTSFTRIGIVFHFLRQALGTQEMPPNQILIGLALFLTMFIMAPVGARVNEQALQPAIAGQVGRLLQLVRDLGLDRDTLFVFTSDNGSTFNGGTDSAFFESAGPFRGLKTMVYEGGIRVPMVARWPGTIPAGTVSAHASAFEDYMPTFAEMAGLERPAGIDGVSMLAALEGRASAQKPREYLYWEFQGKQVVRLGSWKAIRNAATGAFELYDLAKDIGEKTDVAAAHPDIVSRLEAIMRTARTDSELFPLVKPPSK